MAPSVPHEARVRVLETLATLAGFPASAQLGLGLIPDVVRLDVAGRRLFIGDAKATESSGCDATRMRLATYLAEARDWQGAGTGVVFVLAHGEPGQADDWLRTVAIVLREVEMAPTATGSADIGPDCFLAWAWLAEANRPAGLAWSSQGLQHPPRS